VRRSSRCPSRREERPSRLCRPFYKPRAGVQVDRRAAGCILAELLVRVRPSWRFHASVRTRCARRESSVLTQGTILIRGHVKICDEPLTCGQRSRVSCVCHDAIGEILWRSERFSRRLAENQSRVHPTRRENVRRRSRHDGREPKVDGPRFRAAARFRSRREERRSACAGVLNICRLSATDIKNQETSHDEPDLFHRAGHPRVWSHIIRGGVGPGQRPEFGW
jgi:hypothetical protein